MTLRPEYALGHSELNAFLFAPAGKDEAGQELTVLSVLARLDLDPWAEAGRLANLPRAAAAQALAALLYQGDPKTPDAAGRATRLVDFLPPQGVTPIPVVQPPPVIQNTSVEKMKSRPPVWLICIVAAVAWYMLLSYMKADPALEPPTVVTSQ